jgi:cell division protein FtsZ
LQEINEGNNVIFEAAGEEANVIFGCVRKEEMNDYVSYTVIATGFDSARKSFAASSFKSQTKKPGEQLSLRGGFNFMDTTNVDKEDLDVPTILRVKSPSSQMDEPEPEEDSENSYSENASRYSWAKEKMEQKEPNNKSDDDESSSFLRMIMD